MTHPRTLRALTGLAALATALALAGCVAHGVTQVQERDQAPRRDATREQLLGILEEQMNRLATLSAKAQVTAIKQDLLVPASIPDDVRRMSGKPYSKRFGQAEINGLLIFSRRTDGMRFIRFSGDVIGVSTGFMLLGRGNDFWVLLPNTGRDKELEKYRGVMYTGTIGNQPVRDKGVFSVRPQDVVDLFLTDEIYGLLQNKMICYIETWPDYYIMTFLRPDYPEHIYSKVWIERQTLTMIIHQIYDGAGEVIAEGRFGEYQPMSGKNSALTVQIPKQIDFLWPRDKLVMQLTLSNIKVNSDILSSKFDPPNPVGYKIQPLQAIPPPKEPK